MYYVLTAGISIFITALVTTFFTVYYTSPKNKLKWTLGVIHSAQGTRPQDRGVRVEQRNGDREFSLLDGDCHPVLERYIRRKSEPAPGPFGDREYIYINQENSELIGMIANWELSHFDILLSPNPERSYEKESARNQRFFKLCQEMVNRGQGSIGGLRKTNEGEGGGT
jgi:hypothetical protein